MLLAELDANETKNVKGVACLGFPFHPTGKPEKLRTEHFKSINHPIMIIQGERDNMGAKAEVCDYQLPNSIEWLWLADGDHNLKPRIKSGYNQQQHLSQAIDSLAIFITSNIEKSPKHNIS
jgi:predicted alpha/beta-hydrolase family hydrolase